MAQLRPAYRAAALRRRLLGSNRELIVQLPLVPGSGIDTSSGESGSCVAAMIQIAAVEPLPPVLSASSERSVMRESREWL